MLRIQIGMDEILRMQEQDDAKRYEAFKDKFKAKKTTDDCYTPLNVFEAAAAWVAREYGVRGEDVVRPFWPGESYRDRIYPEGCCVLDNPPFSILSEIIRFYCERRVRFFLFAPALTLFAGRGQDVSYIPCGVSVVYENGADVPTSFVTNLDSCRIRTAPALYRAIEDANRDNLRDMHKELPKYSYPDHIVTAAIVQRWCRYGVEYRLPKADCVRVSALDAQKAAGKSIFGGGYLLSSRAAAERAAAERAAATRWQLSEREKDIVRRMDEERTKL